ncbi:hypothetical protein DYB37_002840 [Aphanomyces astaci]|uniref:Uncharacterized protein n=1 Tax=Aphanomyces astaci TaxID=112090 RepID=A0A418E2E2_APHAT|nr:hypothetical protein DYB37_002840 [Aphanomyces astaci]
MMTTTDTPLPSNATVSSSSPTVKTVKAYTPQLAHLTGCPLRESMIHFLGNLRSLDSWKKEEEELAPQLAHLDLTNSPFVKSPMSRSSDIPRLLEFMAESAVQMNFLIRLPSIERCLAEWWQVIAPGTATLVTPPMLTTLYTGLASVMLEARTPNLQQSGVKILMRCKWCKWDKWVATAAPPLTETDVHQLVFQLGYMCVQSDLLHDYTAFFRTTLHKLTVYLDKHGGASKASISERRTSRLQRLESRRRQSNSIVLHPVGNGGSSSSLSSASDHPSANSRGSGDNDSSPLSRMSSLVVPKMIPMTITQFHHLRTNPVSSQVLVTDLGLLLPQFQNKFHVVETMANSIQPLEYAPPLRIHAIPWMNPKASYNPPPADHQEPSALDASQLGSGTTLGDIERLVNHCTRAMHRSSLRLDGNARTNQQQRRDDYELLRRSMSNPSLRQRLQQQQQRGGALT